MKPSRFGSHTRTVYYIPEIVLRVFAWVIAVLLLLAFAKWLIFEAF